jgi:MFS family permease
MVAYARRGLLGDGPNGIVLPENSASCLPTASVTSVIRFLLRTAIFLGSSAIGLLVAAWLVPGVSVSALGFIAAVVIFTVAQAILSPFFLKMASRYASAFLGGIGLVSTLAALILASVLTHGLSIRGIGSWVAATVIVWLVSAVATLLLPVLVLKNKAKQSK